MFLIALKSILYQTLNPLDVLSPTSLLHMSFFTPRLQVHLTLRRLRVHLVSNPQYLRSTELSKFAPYVILLSPSESTPKPT